MAKCDPNIHEYVHRNVLTFLSKISAHASSTEVMKCVHLPMLFLAFMCILVSEICLPPGPHFSL